MLKLTVTIVATQPTFLMDTGHSHNIYSNAKGLGNSFIITATRNLIETSHSFCTALYLMIFQTFIQCFQISGRFKVRITMRH